MENHTVAVSQYGLLSVTKSKAQLRILINRNVINILQLIVT